MKQDIIWGTSWESIDRYEIHNGKGKALTHANTWQNPNKKTRSFNTFKEAMEHLRSTRRSGKIVEFIQVWKPFQIADSSVKGISTDIIQKDADHES
tara:strand:- start:365 stop:652 length:288 start_codon:yes stop_codon:yes gene_type:complete